MINPPKAASEQNKMRFGRFVADGGTSARCCAVNRAIKESSVAGLITLRKDWRDAWMLCKGVYHTLIAKHFDEGMN